MRITFDFVYNYLNLNINQKYDESTELLESFIVSKAIREFDSDVEHGNEYNLDFFMIHEQDINVYFNRIRSMIIKILNCPLKIQKMTDTCDNFLYSLITFTTNIRSLVNQLESTKNGEGEYDESDSFQYQEVLAQIRASILVLGNWKNLPANLIDAKCSYKDKSSIESVYCVAIHTLLSIQNILLYLVQFLTQKMLAKRQLYLTNNYPLCSFVNDDLSEDEQSLFIQHCYLVTNNLIYLHFNTFKKNINVKDVHTKIITLMPCDCVAKSWFLNYCLMQTYDKNGYLSRIQQIFWTSLNRIVNCIKSTKQRQTADENDASIKSNQIYFSSETKCEDLNHFVLLLNNEISSSIRIYNAQSHTTQSADYLDSSYHLLKTTVKEIIEQNQGVGQLYYLKLLTPIQILCSKLASLSADTALMSRMEMQSESRPASTMVCQKVLVDIMINLWEAYFSKYMNSPFICLTSQNESGNTITNSLVQSNDFKHMLHTVEKKICPSQSAEMEEMIDTENDNICYNNSQPNSINIFHLFLKYLYLNLEESAKITGNSASSSAWRTFKGRLYTRLHDKRISEFDLTGIINLSYLFFVLIKSFSSNSLVISQLRFDQLENFYRILGVFIKSRNLEKLDAILWLSSQHSVSDKVVAKTNALKSIMNAKFTALRLWFQTSELSPGEANTLASNEEEIKQIINQEFADYINNWLVEAVEIQKSSCSSTGGYAEPKFGGNQNLINTNQITNYKNSQMINQFLCDMILNHMENCRQFLFQPGDATEVIDSSSKLHLLADTSCQLLIGIKFDCLLKLLSRKQFEMICSKLTEIITINKRLIQNQLASYAYNSSLSNNMSNFTLRIWNILLAAQQSSTHTPTVFSYELISNCYFEICSLYSCLFFNPETLLVNSSNKMKTLLGMIEQVCFATSSSSALNDETGGHATTIRLKFINHIMKEQRLFEMCDKSMNSFQQKLVSFLIYAYLNNSSIGESSTTSGGVQTTTSYINLVDAELNVFLTSSVDKISIFNELQLRNRDLNIENFLTEFIKKYAARLKQITSFADKKDEIQKFTVYFQDFVKLINSMQAISSHAVIYKCYLLASQIVLFMSIHLHSRGRSDTIFAKIIDKMVLPFGLTKPNGTSGNLKPLSNNNVVQSNNQNSIFISLKDTLHLFLTGISQLNYEYDGYLQRVLQTIIVNFSIKFQMLQFEDHFLTLALEESFQLEPSDDIIRFRTYLFKCLKQKFLVDLKATPDTEKYLGLLNHFLLKTKSIKVINEDARIHFGSVLLLLGNEMNSLKTKALSLFALYMRNTKKLNSYEEDPTILEETEQLNSVYIDAIESFLKTFWHQMEPSRIFISLSLIAKHNKQLVTSSIKYLILQKIEETPSKFRFNAELKNTLYTLYELLDGDKGKMYLNDHLSHILNI